MTEPAATRVPAELDRRLYAFVVDRLVAWTVAAGAASLTLRHLVGSDRPVVVVPVVVGCVVAVGGVLAVVLGLTGASPGRAVTRLRVVDASTGAPLGVARALRRQLLLGLAALPTFGLGVATLAWTAVADPAGRRRGWHDRVAGSEVLDVRPPRAEPAPDAELGPRHVVNLTALRLVPVPASGSVAPPAGRPRPAAPGPHPHRAPARWRVGFDTGESLVVDGPVLLGRDPEPRPGEPVRRLVPLRSEALSLSKTHAQLRLAAGGLLEVVDRGSTNGSVLRRRGAVRELPAGRPTTLLEGDVVVFGDREMRVGAAIRPSPPPDGSITVR